MNIKGIDRPAACNHCGDAVTRANRYHKGVWIRGKRIDMHRVWAFCSPECREAWWFDPAQTTLFPTLRPWELKNVSHENPSAPDEADPPCFVYADESELVGDLRTKWSDYTMDTNFTVVVWEHNLDEVHFNVVFKDGSVEPFTEANMVLVHERVVGHGEPVLGFKMSYDCVREMRRFATPTDFHTWWKEPVQVEYEASVTAPAARSSLWSRDEEACLLLQH